MKKNLRFIVAALFMFATSCSFAQLKETYTEDLVVTINSVSAEPQPATINVESLANGNINFTLNNFVLVMGEDVMPVGNIELKDLPLTDEGAYKSFSFEGNIAIQPGGNSIEFGGETYEMTAEDWVGPALGEIPMTLKGKVSENKLYVTIDIVMAALGQNVSVVLGTDFDASSISNTLTTSKPVAAYSIAGTKSIKGMKGLNIIKMSDGKVKKVLVK